MLTARTAGYAAFVGFISAGWLLYVSASSFADDDRERSDCGDRVHHSDGDFDDDCARAAKRAVVITADCRYTGSGLQAAVDQARGPTTIVVRGTCTEKVLIRKDDITITGDARGTGEISGTVEGRIRIEGSDRIVIQFLRIRGMGEGIDVARSSSAEIADCVIANNELDGIRVLSGSAVTLERCEVTSNDLNATGRGIALFDNSTMFLGGGSDIRNNGGEGGANLWLETGSTVFQTGNDAIIANDATEGFAIFILNGAIADVRGALVDGDVFVHGHSTFRTQSNAINGDIDVSGQSLVGFRRSTTFSGALRCDDSSEPFGPEVGLAAVSCNQRCDGRVPDTCSAL